VNNYALSVIGYARKGICRLSNNPEIPRPTREDLLRLVHGENRDMLAAGKLEAQIAETLWSDAERRWYEGHNAAAAQADAAQADAESKSDQPQQPGGGDDEPMRGETTPEAPSVSGINVSDQVEVRDEIIFTASVSDQPAVVDALGFTP